MNKILLKALMIRPATMDDMDSIFELAQAYELDLYNEVEVTLDDLHTWYSMPGIDLQHDSLLVFAEHEQLLATLLMEQQQSKFFVSLRVRPGLSEAEFAYQGQGRFDDYLMKFAEDWSRERIGQLDADLRVTLSAWSSASNLQALECCERAGLSEVRRFWRMEIEIDGNTPAPVWPAGVALCPFEAERDAYAVYAMIEDAFQDHWGFLTHSYEEFRHFTVDRADFDPSLWFLAYEGDEMAGASLCIQNASGGWVDTLGIRRPWRRKGVALALLHYTFGEFYRRGQTKVGLSVDSQSLTGATHLYVRAGMHMAREIISLEKELRAGRELSTQTLPV